ncbi:MAG TPA: ATPase, partial [Fervidobacterium sp.]|nr:ATPase [Fervidobacterium sp.]
ILGNMYKNMDDLICVYGASNHVPQDPLLLAFFDRFPIRLLVKHVEPSVENYKKLLQKEISIEVSDKVDTILTRKESINFAKEFNRLVTTRIEELIDNDFLKSIFNSVKYLKSGAEIFISDRNLKHIVKMIVAYSMLRSEKTSAVPNKTDIIFILTKIWNNEEQKDEIERFLVR